VKKDNRQCTGQAFKSPPSARCEGFCFVYSIRRQKSSAKLWRSAPLYKWRTLFVKCVFFSVWP